MSQGSPHLFSDLVVYLRVTGHCWAIAYLLYSFIATSWALHLVVVGLGVCLFSYFRLPPPPPSLVRAVLGPEPSEDESCSIPWEVAHRAACLDAPENSLEAVRLAASHGATCVEFDVSFTSDGTAVAFHDDTLDRVTEGSGPIEDITFSQLSRLDLSLKHPLSANFQGVKIPKVEDFVAECLRLNMKVIMDMKTWESPDETVALVTSLYKKMPELKTKCLITSFFPQLLYRLRASDVDLVCSLSNRPFFISSTVYNGTDSGLRPRFSGAQQLLARAADFVFPWLLEHVLWWLLGLSAVAVHKAMVTQQMVRDWRKRGVRVFAWTVNSPLEKAWMRHNMGVQVLTDTLDRLPQEKWATQL